MAHRRLPGGTGPLKLKFTADVSALDRYLTQQATAFDEAADAAVIETTEALKEAGRQQIAGRLSSRAGNLFAARYYLKQRGADGNLGTVGYTHSRWWRRSASGQRVDILAEYETGATIRPVRGRRIAIPLPAAGQFGLGISGRRSRISPEAFERRTGLKLQPVQAKDGRIFLVVDGRLNSAGQAAAFKGGRLTKTGRLKSGAASIPVFVLVPSATLPKRLDLAAIVDREQNNLGSRVLAEISRRTAA